MVKAKFSISSWALQEGHLCSEAVLLSSSEMLVVVSARGERGQCVRMRFKMLQEGGKGKALLGICHPQCSFYSNQ